MYDHTYEAPSLERFGSIETLTGIKGCYIPIGSTKGAFGETDKSWKFPFLCDLEGEDPSSGL